jgi:phosphate-selective porin OprO and OprP
VRQHNYSRQEEPAPKEEYMKRGIAVMVSVLALTAAVPNSQAKTLEEVLKEKGVITEADYNDILKSAPKTTPVAYKLGSGFTFTSPDEKYQLIVGGQVQTRYTFTQKDGANAVSNVSAWNIPRARTFLSGYFLTKDLTFKSYQDWAALNNWNSGSTNSNTSKVMLETFMNYRIVDEAQLRIGQDKVQYSRQYITSSSQNEFVDNSFVTSAFVPGYDTGVAVLGSVEKGLFTYSAAWAGGNGQNVVATDNNNSYTIRLTANPFGEVTYSEGDLQGSAKPLLGLGGSYYHDAVRVSGGTVESTNLGYLNTTNGWLGKNIATFTGTQNINVNMFEADTVFKWQGLALQAEYFWGQANGSVNSTQNLIAKGFYTQLGYMVMPKTVELALRYNWMDYNAYKSDSLKSEVQGAISWYINSHNLKIQADVTSSTYQKNAANSTSATAPAAGQSNSDTIFRTQAQILF